MEYGIIIKKLRDERRLSQEYMASELNISQAAYSKLESGHIELSLDYMNKICALFQIKIEDLIRRDVEKLTTLTPVSQSEVILELYKEDNKFLKSQVISLTRIIESLQK